MLADALAVWAVGKPIEQLTTDDLVLTRAQANADAAPQFRRVVETFERLSHAIATVVTLDPATGTTDVIESTPYHPFWVAATPPSAPAPLANAGASSEQSGRRVYRTRSGNGHGRLPQRADGTHPIPADALYAPQGWVFARDLKQGYALTTADGRRVLVLAVKVEQARRAVYNLEVAPTHTYFVGHRATWVHNDNAPDAPGTGLSPTAPPSRIQGPWTERDLARAAEGKPPRDFFRDRRGRPAPVELHHADQMPGSAVHEAPPHHSGAGVHGRPNQGVTNRREPLTIGWLLVVIG